MTTSASSANARALPSNRRGFIASLAATGLLTGSAVPALAGEPGPVEQMYPEHIRLAKIRDASLAALWAAEERYTEPRRPPWRLGTEGGFVVFKVGKQNLCFLDDSDANIAELGKLVASEFDAGTDQLDAHMNKLRAQRAKTVLADIEAWKAEVQRRTDAAGLTQAREADARAREATEAHAAAVLALRPTTFRELAFRAAVLLITWDEGEACLIADRLTELAGIEPYEPDY